MIGVLIFPDFQLLDAAGPISAFEVAARFAGQPAVDQGAGGNAGPGSQFVRRRDAGARPQTIRGDQHPDRGRRRGRARGRELRRDTCQSCVDMLEARHPRRQRLLRRLYPGGSRRARRPPRHHALAAHPAFREGLSQDKTGARPDLRSRRQHLEFGRDQCRHRSGAGNGGGGFWRRRRTAGRAPTRGLRPPQRRPMGFTSLLELKAPAGRFGRLLTWARDISKSR